MLSGVGITLSSLDPIKALFWRAIINRVVFGDDDGDWLERKNYGVAL
jgi:hypothetical protein